MGQYKRNRTGQSEQQSGLTGSTVMRVHKIEVRHQAAGRDSGMDYWSDFYAFNRIVSFRKRRAAHQYVLLKALAHQRFNQADEMFVCPVK